MYHNFFVCQILSKMFMKRSMSFINQRIAIIDTLWRLLSNEWQLLISGVVFFPPTSITDPLGKNMAEKYPKITKVFDTHFKLGF